MSAAPNAAEPIAAATVATEKPRPPTTVVTQPPGDPLALWQVVTESLDGLVADFAATATAAAWREGVLEVTLPAEAATAASFLRRSDSVASIAAGLAARAGGPVRHAIVLAPPKPAGAEAERPPQATVNSQTALVRAATDHPLVAHARTLFDAAIRKVEPLRPREVEPAVAAVAAVAAGGSPAAAAGDDAGPSDEEAEGDDG